MGFLDDIIDPETAPLHISQGSEEWEQIRAGRFTSSEIWKLMKPGKRPMTPEELAARPKSGVGSKTTQVDDYSRLSNEGETYVRVKVAEILTGQPRPETYAFPLVYGKEKEPEAVEFYERVTGNKTETVGFQTFGDHAGGSPDRMIPGKKWGLELKCPFTIDKQVDYLYLPDVLALKELYPDYYYQCVSLILFTDSDGWDFATYDPRYIEDRHKLFILSIPVDEVKHEFGPIIKALESAIRQKLQMLQTLRK